MVIARFGGRLQEVKRLKTKLGEFGFESSYFLQVLRTV
jgi:hypothetical protein